MTRAGRRFSKYAAPSTAIFRRPGFAQIRIALGRYNSVPADSAASALAVERVNNGRENVGDAGRKEFLAVIIGEGLSKKANRRSAVKGSHALDRVFKRFLGEVQAH